MNETEAASRQRAVDRLTDRLKDQSKHVEELRMKLMVIQSQYSDAARELAVAERAAGQTANELTSLLGFRPISN